MFSMQFVRCGSIILPIRMKIYAAALSTRRTRKRQTRRSYLVLLDPRLPLVLQRTMVGCRWAWNRTEGTRPSPKKFLVLKASCGVAEALHATHAVLRGISRAHALLHTLMQLLNATSATSTATPSTLARKAKVKATAKAKAKAKAKARAKAKAKARVAAREEHRSVPMEQPQYPTGASPTKPISLLTGISLSPSMTAILPMLIMRHLTCSRTTSSKNGVSMIMVSRNGRGSVLSSSTVQQQRRQLQLSQHLSSRTSSNRHHSRQRSISAVGCTAEQLVQWPSFSPL